jgi:hypothetical protein
MRLHRFDVLSFVAGLVFTASGIAYLVNDGRWRFDTGPWVWPVVLLVGGAIVLLSTIRDERHSRVVTGPDTTYPPAESAAPTGVDEIDEIEPGNEVL